MSEVLTTERRALGVKRFGEWAWSGEENQQPIGELKPQDAARAAWMAQEAKIAVLEDELAEQKAAAGRVVKAMHSALGGFGFELDEQDPERLASMVGQLGTAFSFVCEAIGLATMFGDRAGHPSLPEWDEEIRLLNHEQIEKVLWPRFVAAFCFLKDMRGEERPGLSELAARDVAMIEALIRHERERRAKAGG